MRDFCLGCVIRHQLKKEGAELERYLEKCPHSGEKFFVLYGPAPKTHKDVDRIARVLRTEYLGLSNTPGPKKKKLTLGDIIRALEKISPDAPLAQFATELGVSPRKAQELVKQLVGQTFREIQAARRSGPWAPAFSKKYQRRRR